MTVRVAINGFGRIGRCVVRALVESGRNDIHIVAVNGSGPIEMMAHLLKHDSVHGAFPAVEVVNESTLRVAGQEIKVIMERDPAKLPWLALNIDVVMECTGKFTKSEEAGKHLAAGARKVLISAPADGAEATVVYGVNNHVIHPELKIMSIGSCTTNALAPVAQTLQKAVGIDVGFMTTIHSYTGDQNVVDGSHRDLRRARACAMSMVPTSTGAAKAIGLVIPELAGKLNGTSIRVPTPNVSLIDFTFTARQDTDKETLVKAFETAAESELKGVLAVCHEPLVSIDFNHNTHSAIVDAKETHVVQKRFCRVAAWYDNEWGFSHRMLDVAALIGKR
ncbi:MAG: type I glyceraldehyde-3-phosphate dehydrogenase [Alphaproteobacteria bacterium]|nr:type I glyceraldehyde-3-phosphate dehydrogenase [Alphaproteobacteria bacterium]